MGFSPIPSQQIEGEKMEAVTDFLFLGSKITVESDFSHEIRGQLFPGRKDITSLTKVHLVKAMVFPVVMYRWESWTMKKARVLKNWCFQTVVLEKTLESPLERKEIKPVNLKVYQSWLSLEGLMLTQKLQYFGHLMQTDDSLEKTLMLGKIESRRGWPVGITNSMEVNLANSRTGKPDVLQSMGSQRVEYNLVTEQQQKVNSHWEDKRLRSQ